jgi:SAM-dependent methyltransferase
MKGGPMGASRCGVRGCPSCGMSERDILYHQHFLEPAGQHLMDEYLVCVCRGCGMAYADGIPTQELFDSYYQARSKYEYPEREGEASPHDLDRFNRVVDEISRLAPDRGQRILEVGASTGAMLCALRDRGYDRLLGLDPSPACKGIAARHGVLVENLSPAALTARGETFDMVLLLAVLEHVRDLGPFLEVLMSVLAPGGALFVQVPDAAAFHVWPDAPYQQFSTEHINYFSRTSLGNLLRPRGLEEEARWEYAVSGGQGCTLPVLDMLFRLTGRRSAVSNLVRDQETETALKRYIALSAETDAHLEKTLAGVARSRREIIVWGVGTHTQRLLAEGRMAGLNIAAYVDSNSHLQGTTLGGKPILAPRELEGRKEPILISSRASQEEIRSQILKTLGLRNEIITLYQL